MGSNQESDNNNMSYSRPGRKTPTSKKQRRPDPLHPISNQSAPGNHSERSSSSPANISANNTHSRKQLKHKRVYLKPPRCSRGTFGLAVPLSHYSWYGRSSDLSYDCPTYRLRLPNPYVDLARAVHEELKKKQEALAQASQQLAGRGTSQDTDSASTSVESQSAEDSKRGGSPGRGDRSNNESSKEREAGGGKGEEIQEEEDDEDEEGMPQAVRPSEPRHEPQTSLEMLKAVHFRRMEDTCKATDPRMLLRHLQDSGYFNYNYQPHTRTTTDNTNLRNGSKKGIEKLYHILASF